MTTQDIINLGWHLRNKNRNDINLQNVTFKYPALEEGNGHHIMGIFLDENDFYLVSINYVDPKVNCNEWDNSECHFYGDIKTIEELDLVMQFLGIIEYKGIQL